MSEQVSIKRLPVVTIVGRPNAGKSTLFNRLVPGQTAIVDSTPGVTRDRNIATVKFGGKSFVVVDTGGFENRDKTTLAESVRTQSAIASEESDVIVVLLDAQMGLHPDDHTLVDRIRPLRKPTLFAVNKIDADKHEDDMSEFYALGAEELYPVSAAHGRGVRTLFEAVAELLPEQEEEAEAGEGAVRLAIIGRPNVGKSSLVNRLVGFERAVVDSVAGTTRDSLDTPFRHGETDYILVDTAGIRRRSRVQEHIERISVVRALRALERAELAVLVLDAEEGIHDQDARIAGYALERRRALLIAVNKIDLLPRSRRDPEKFAAAIADQYRSLAEVPVVGLSAQTGAGVQTLFPALERVIASHRKRIQTADLNRVLHAAVESHSPPAKMTKPPRFYYATQVASAPPLIAVFTNNPAEVTTSYERYLLNTFRRAFDLVGTPAHLSFRKRHKDDDTSDAPSKPSRPPRRQPPRANAKKRRG